jgi:hypothetical protein
MHAVALDQADDVVERAGLLQQPPTLEAEGLVGQVELLDLADGCADLGLVGGGRLALRSARERLHEDRRDLPSGRHGRAPGDGREGADRLG